VAISPPFVVNRCSADGAPFLPRVSVTITGAAVVRGAGGVGGPVDVLAQAPKLTAVIAAATLAQGACTPLNMARSHYLLVADSRPAGPASILVLCRSGSAT
jgi:hypothetical protein